LFRPEDFGQLLEFGLGLTDLAKGACGSDAQVSTKEYDVPAFWAKMERFCPGLVVFTSKTAARLALERNLVDYGLTAGERPVFVLPSPSGAARGSWNEVWWGMLAEKLRS
jgi:TDG/mug DNA glycosylase family protein